MPESAVAASTTSRLRARLPRPSPGTTGGTPLLPKWSVPAAMRAVRATVVIPSLFALTFKVIGDPQMALFATFGGFATLVLASFGGSRKDKAVAHLGLALAGTALIAIGTAVSSITWLAALVTVPVAFMVFFAGIAGPNAASGVTAALLAYVLPVASAGTASMIPARLEGWWLASVVSTAAVLLLSPRPPGDRLRAAAAASAAATADYLQAAVNHRATPEQADACVAAKHELTETFATTPYRPTGLATADQGLSSLVQLLEWCASLCADTLHGHVDLEDAAAVDRELLGTAAGLLEDVAWLVRGQDITTADVGRDVERVQRARAASAACHRDRDGSSGGREAAMHAADAHAIAVTARGAVADALVAARRADMDTVAAARRSWYGELGARPARRPLVAGLSGAAGLAARHASLRSVWFVSAARGALALAAAVAVADLTSVQHGFWVVLGTLSVLRTNAAATGSTVLRALAGTVVGFAVGAALLLGIGTSPVALWIALPVAILVAAYTPGTAPFALGQAAFTITVVVLFNLLVPAGWKVGLLRVEDVALGCAVSVVVGVLFWPRGASTVVGNDLTDSFRRGAAYLSQAVDWSLGLRQQQPDAGVPAVTAGIRLDDALRGFLAEQGTKRLPKQDLWTLVMAATRLRLTANSVASLHEPGDHGDTARHPAAGPDPGDPLLARIRQVTADLTGFYERIATVVGPPRRGREPEPFVVPELPGGNGSSAEGSGTSGPGPDVTAGPGPVHPHVLWVSEHLRHLQEHAPAIREPAERLARLRRTPWWR
jgi:uncharacterized membrane protein YccC